MLTKKKIKLKFLVFFRLTIRIPVRHPYFLSAQKEPEGQRLSSDRGEQTSRLSETALDLLFGREDRREKSSSGKNVENQCVCG